MKNLILILLLFACNTIYAQFKKEYDIEILQQSDESKLTMSYNSIVFSNIFPAKAFHTAYDEIYAHEFIVLLTDEKPSADIQIDYKNMTVTLNAVLTKSEREYLLSYAMYEIQGVAVNLPGIISLY